MVRFLKIDYIYSIWLKEVGKSNLLSVIRLIVFNWGGGIVGGGAVSGQIKLFE